MASKKNPKSSSSRNREALKFKLASKVVSKKRMASKRQPSKGQRSYQRDDD